MDRATTEKTLTSMVSLHYKLLLLAAIHFQATIQLWDWII